MITLRSEDTFHKVQLLRLLAAILDNTYLSQNLYFKGGTCAALLGLLDRFSVDLDFDLKETGNKKEMKRIFYQVFAELDLSVKDESQKTLSFLLKYQAPSGSRNTIKLDALDLPVKANVYKVQYLAEINRLANCQTKETMFANKLVAVLDRWEKHRSIAGRDLYDIHYFFLQGYDYLGEVIKERTGLSVYSFLTKLRNFINAKITSQIINEDLNSLLVADKFSKIRLVLKNEVLLFLDEEIGRLK